MRPKIDRLLSGGEKRELLKMISRGAIANVNDLRAYLGRVEQMKVKHQEEQTCKLAGKCVDADSRRPIPRVRVKIQHTTYDEDTDGSGNWLWEGCVKGRQYVIEASARSYRAMTTQYKATMDDEQAIVIKLPPLQRGGPQQGGGPGGQKKGPGGGH